METADRIDRRHFGAQLALGAGVITTALAPLALTCAEDQKPAAGNAVSDRTGQGGDRAEKKGIDPAAAPALPPTEVLLLTYLMRRHPSDQYDEAAVQGIFRDIRGDVARGRQLSEFPLTNADEPAFTFGAYRGSSPAVK